MSLLVREFAHDGLAYTGAASGYQDYFVLKIRINGSHGSACRSSGIGGSPGTAARKPNRSPTSGCALRSSADRPSDAVVAYTMQLSWPPNAILVTFAQGNRTVASSSPRGE